MQLHAEPTVPESGTKNALGERAKKIKSSSPLARPSLEQARRRRSTLNWVGKSPQVRQRRLEDVTASRLAHTWFSLHCEGLAGEAGYPGVFHEHSLTPWSRAGLCERSGPACHGKASEHASHSNGTEADRIPESGLPLFRYGVRRAARYSPCPCYCQGMGKIRDYARVRIAYRNATASAILSIRGQNGT